MTEQWRIAKREEKGKIKRKKKTCHACAFLHNSVPHHASSCQWRYTVFTAVANNFYCCMSDRDCTLIWLQLSTFLVLDAAGFAKWASIGFHHFLTRALGVAFHNSMDYNGVESAPKRWGDHQSNQPENNENMNFFHSRCPKTNYETFERNAHWGKTQFLSIYYK